MTISSDAIRKAGPYVGTGIATVFAFAFKAFSQLDLSITLLTTATGVQQLLVLNTDYTVQLNGNQDINPGGTITTIGAISPIANTKTLTISGNVMADTQGTDLITPGPWVPDDVEKMVDRAMIAVQQLRDRTLKFPVIDAVAPIDFPAAEVRAGKFLGFDAAGALAFGASLGVALTTTVIGQVPFGAAGNTLAQDPNLFWDNTNKRLGVGTSNPALTLDINGAARTATTFVVGTNFQVAGDSALFGSTALDTASKIVVRGITKAVRIGAGTAAIIDGVDNTGTVSFQPLAISGSTVSLGIAGTPKLTVNADGSVTFVVSALTPIVDNPAGTLSLRAAGNQVADVVASGSGGIFPHTDNVNQLGSPSFKWAAVFSHVFDSGDTGPIQFKTNNGSEQFRVGHVGSSVDFIQAAGSAASNPGFLAVGTSAAINMFYDTKGTGIHTFRTDGSGATLGQFQILHTASSNRNVTITGGNGTPPTLDVTAGGILNITPAVVIAGSSIRLGTNPSNQGGLNIAYSSVLASRNSANSGDINLIQAVTVNSVVDTTRIGVSGSGCILVARSGAGIPTTSDIAAGQWMLWRDTSGATTKLYYNNAGSLQSVALV